MFQLATPDDLAALEAQFLARFTALEGRVSKLEAGPVTPPPDPNPPPIGQVRRVTDKISDALAAFRPGDIIEVMGRADPYREKIDLWHSDFTLRGVPGPNGEPVVIDGEGATETVQYGIPDVETLGVISVYHRQGSDEVPTNLTFQGITVRGGYFGRKYKKHDGSEGTYADHAGGFWLGHFANVTIQDCWVIDCGMGIFASGNQENIGLTIRRNKTAGNGLAEGTMTDRCHTFYCECGGTLYEDNEMGAMRVGSGGGQIKDRGDVVAVRRNKITGGARQVDLSYPESSLRWMKARPTYVHTLVEGNTLILREGDGVQWLYGEGRTDDFGNGQTIELTRNTLVCWRDNAPDRDAAIVCGTADDYTPQLTLIAMDNIIYTSKKTAAGFDCWSSWVRKGNKVILKGRNVVPGWIQPAYKGAPGTTVEGAGLMPYGVQDKGMPDMGFTDLAGGDYRIKAGSEWAGLGA